MSKPQTADPLLDPIGYLVTAKSKAKAPSLAQRSKSDDWAGEKSRLVSEHEAELRLLGNLQDFDQVVKPALKKIEPLLTRHQRLVIVEKSRERLASFYQGKWMTLARVGVSDEGNWQVTNDREEIEETGNAETAMALLLGYLAPTFHENERAKQAEAERPAQQEAQEKYIATQTAPAVHAARKARLS